MCFTSDYLFSTHAPTQRATKLLRNIISADKVSDLNVLSEFQLTLPCRKRQYIAAVKHLSKLGFNSRSHGGSDGGADSGYTKNAVSIHAPMKGAIEMDSHFNSHTPVSTHAPTQGAISSSKRAPAQTQSFNSRSYVGNNCVPVIRPRFSVLRFNSRSYVGSNSKINHKATILARFNSRSHIGSNYSLLPIMGVQDSFNSRSHVGSNTVVLHEYVSSHVSTHAPTQGAITVIFN